MNCSSYIFGNFESGYTQYPDDQTRDMFLFCSQLSGNQHQMIVHREEKIMHYIYIHTLDANKGTYIGISFNVSEMMVDDFSGLYSLLQNTLVKLAVQGNILDFNYSDIVSKTNHFYKKEVEIQKAFNELMEELERFQDSVIPLPPKAYGINQQSYNITGVEKDKSKLVEDSNKYGYLVLTKKQEKDIQISDVKTIIDSVPLKRKHTKKYTIKDKLLFIFIAISILEFIIILIIK